MRRELRACLPRMCRRARVEIAIACELLRCFRRGGRAIERRMQRDARNARCACRIEMSGENREALTPAGGIIGPLAHRFFDGFEADDLYPSIIERLPVLAQLSGSRPSTFDRARDGFRGFLNGGDA